MKPPKIITMKTPLVPLLLAGILLCPAADAVEVADAALDYQTAPEIDIAGGFAPTAPPEGWEYLYSDAFAGGTEVALLANDEVGNAGNDGFGGDAGTNGTPAVLGTITGGGTDLAVFTNAGHAGVVGEDLLIHPGNTPQSAYVIVRYTINADDIDTIGNFAAITGSFRDLQGNNNANAGGSVQVQVLLNDTSLFSATGAESRLFADGMLPSGIFNLETTVAAGDTISFVVFNNGPFFGDETALQASIDLTPPPVDMSPRILTDPISQDLFISDTLNLSVSASGEEPLSYQWQRDGVDIPGATEPTFTIDSLVAEDAGSYVAVVTNNFGSTPSAAAVITLEVLRPTVITQPIAQTLAIGDTLTLSITVEGSEPITFQWLQDLAPIIGANESTYTVASVTIEDAGEYECEVENSAGEDLSEFVVVEVRDNVAPVGIAQDEATSVNVPLILPVAQLATDADNDPLLFVGADLTSAGGATVIFSETEAAYIPVPNSTATDDTFNVIVSDGFEMVTVPVTVDVLSTESTVIANPAADYVDSSTLPDSWTYLSSDAASGGFETALQPDTGLGNGGNTGFGNTGVNFNVPAILGGLDGGAQFEIFDDGFEGSTESLDDGNRGLEGIDLLFHTGDDAGVAFAIARYTVTAADLASGSNAVIEGSFRDLSGGTGGGGADSVAASIFLNGTELFSATGAGGRLFPSDATFNLTPVATINAGDIISFAVGNNGTFGGDETALRATISLTGTPAPQASGVILDAPEIIGDDVVFTFTRDEGAEDTEVFVFEFSEDLMFGAPNQILIDTGAPEVTLGTPSGGRQEVTVTIGIDTLANTDRLFGRVVNTLD